RERIVGEDGRRASAEHAGRDRAARTGAPEHAAGGGVTATRGYFLTVASTTDLSCARPFSISRPIILSMFMNRQSALAKKLLRPAMLQVTAVRSASRVDGKSGA